MISYKEAGVDIDAGNSFVEAIKPLVGATSNEHCIGEIGSFSGAFALPAGCNDLLLKSGNDGQNNKIATTFVSKNLSMTKWLNFIKFTFYKIHFL